MGQQCGNGDDNVGRSGCASAVCYEINLKQLELSDSASNKIMVSAANATMEIRVGNKANLQYTEKKV